MNRPVVRQFPRMCMLVLLFGLSAGVQAAHQGGGKYADPPAVDWWPCYEWVAPVFECAWYRVPLDHSEASPFFYVDGGQQEGIDIALIRVPATDPDNKIGSLFLNPGGPGGSGVFFVLNVGQFLYTPEVRAHFDIVGFDPRGINFSAPLSCFTNFDHLDELNKLDFYPDTDEQAMEQTEFDRRFNEHCELNAGAIRDNMSTADVARDMDIMRAAVGDRRLNYAGYSYGSFLGVSYANMFPKRVRALIVDAVLDPIQWTTGDALTQDYPMTYRLRSDAGAKATLDEFFRLCDLAGPERCAISGDSEDRFYALRERLRTDPITLVFDDGSEQFIDHKLATVATLQNLYNPFAWEFLALDFAFLESIPVTSVTANELSVLGRVSGQIANAELVQQTIEGFPGVTCSDSDNPDDGIAWAIAAADAERDYGIFGPPWTWAGSPCAHWSASQSSRFTGPFSRYTANPVLVTSTLYDPATRYEGAVTVSNLLPNSHLLTVEGWGHATLFLSGCATQIASDYLVSGALPSSPSTCQQDFPPFQLDASEVFSNISGASGLQAEGMARDEAEEARAAAMRSIRGDRPTYSSQ